MFIERFKLTVEQKAKPYAKYFYQEPAPCDPKQLAKMDNAIDPSQALPIDRMNDLLNPGYLECETGWCVMPDGSAFIANHSMFKGVTLDMLRWWFAWHSLDDLRYKIWWPKGHFHITVDEKSREKILDPSTPMNEKLWGMTHHVVESCDAPTENIYINFKSPEDMGFNMDRFDHKTMAAFGGCGVSQMINPPPGAPNHKGSAAMLHFCREVEGGVEMRSRFWIGKKILNKKPIHCLPGGVKLPFFVAKCLARHNVMEYANLARLIPAIYPEQGPRMED